MRRAFVLAFGALFLLQSSLPLLAAERFIVLASTTSTEQSGLFGQLLPLFKAQTGIEVRVVAVGTGQALQLGVRGDADALLVHDRQGEEDLVAKGHALDRRDVMFNDFIMAGPDDDPAKIAGLKDAKEVAKRIATSKSTFVSRGDDSGTHRLELRLWKAAGAHTDETADVWYRDVGTGMGQALNIAAAMNAYILSDRATWANFKNRQRLTLLADGDPLLFNPYSSLLVNPAKGVHIKSTDAKIWHEWLTSAAGQDAIAAYKINGEQLFFTNPPVKSQ